MIFNERGGATRSVAAWTSLLLMFSVIAMGPAFAAHEVLSLPDSEFEIDLDANLKVDDGGWIDWLAGGPGTPLRDGVTVVSDKPSGSGDDAFGQGSKEDTAVPTVVDGSIPPNKSDLKQFGVYTERNESGSFLHLFWTRVQDPSGTTLMDFEFNKEKCDTSDPDNSVCSGNGVTPVRTPGDLLITYELSQGGVQADLFLYEWLVDAADGTCEASNKYPCWGNQIQLDTSGDAAGSINASLIPKPLDATLDESGGLGPLDPRTFGEASIDLDAIFDPGACESFGSAYLKSRSSDSFTAALKDFIAPTPVNLSNCGTVITRKVTDPSPDPTTTSFGFTSNLVTDPADTTAEAFSLSNGGAKTVNNVLAGSYTVTESDPTSAGFTLTGIDCSASTSVVSPSTDAGARTASFTLGAGEIVDCTFTNTLQRGSITVVKNTVGGDGTFDFTSSTLGNFSLTTESNTASTLFDELIPGTYDVAETVPTGWDLTSATCDDGSDPASIGLDPGEDVTCTFVNTQRGKILVDKVTNPSGSTQSFDFALTGGPDSLNQSFSLTDNATPHDSGFVKPGTYAASETVPTGWTQNSATCTGPGSDQSPEGLTVGAGETWTCTFNNSTGAILISKDTKDANDAFDENTNPNGDGRSPLSGVTFEVRVGNENGDLVTPPAGGWVTDSNGQVCVGGLTVATTYWIKEIGAPTGYDVSAVATQTKAAEAAECGETGAGDPALVEFINDPLSKIQILFTSLAGPGVTVADISCVDGDGNPVAPTPDDTTSGFDDIDEIYTNLVEGTYVCTIVVDP